MVDADKRATASDRIHERHERGVSGRHAKVDVVARTAEPPDIEVAAGCGDFFVPRLSGPGS